MPTIDIILNGLPGNVKPMLSGVAGALGDLQNKLNGTSQSSVDAGKKLQDALDKAKVAADSCSKSIKGTNVSVDDLRKRIADTGMTLKDAIKSFQLSGDAAKDAADAYRKAGKDGADAARDVAQAQRGVQSALQSSTESLSKWSQGLQMARNAGLGMMAVGSAFEYAAYKGVENAASMETQIKTLEALTGSAKKARDIFKEVDDYSVKSIAELPDLITSAKNLQASGIYSIRNLRAADDLAAQGRDRGVTAPEISFALSRIANGDFGRGFERARELGINRTDLEAQGLKFNNSNEYADKTAGGAQRAVEGLVRAIEKKFGGLSEKLGAGTLEGSLSNLHDAFGRVSRSIFDELLPAATFITHILTGVAGVFNELPGPVRKIIAYGTVLIGALLILGGGLLAVVATAGIGVIALSGLGISITAAGVTAGGATIGFGALAASLGAVLLSVGLVALGIVAAIAVIVAATYGIYKAAQWLSGKIDEQFGKGAASKFMGTVGATVGGVAGSVIPGGGVFGSTFGGWLGDKAAGGSDPVSDKIAQVGDAKKTLDDTLADAKKQMDALKKGDYNPKTGVAGVPDSMVGASGAGANTDIEALEDKIAATDDKEERKALREQLRMARRQSKHEKTDERESTQVANQASRENATDLTEAARVQAEERKAATREEIQGLTSARKAERRADEDAQERMNRGYELAHSRARNLDLEHMEGIVALQKAGFSLDQIGTARDVYKSLQQSGAAKETPEDRLRESWAKEDRNRDFRRREEDKDEALRKREEGMRGESTADAGSIMAQAKSRGAWGKNGDITRARAAAQEQIARIKAGQSGNADGENKNEIEYSNGDGIHRIRVPRPRAVSQGGKKVRFEFEPFEAEISSRSDRDARSYR